MSSEVLRNASLAGVREASGKLAVWQPGLQLVRYVSASVGGWLDRENSVGVLGEVAETEFASLSWP